VHLQRHTEPGHRRVRPSRVLLVFLLVAAFIPFLTSPASAAASLSITPNTWNVVGLDSNDVTDGPNEFLAGIRICNTGDAAASNVVATFVWDTAATYVNLQPGSGSTRTLGSLASGACTNAYFNIEITRNTNAYDTARRFHISATADGLGTVSTPTPREIYVEHLISQNRNAVIGITGPSTVYVGNTYTYVVDSSTATQGYEQLSSFLNWPGAIFEVQSVSATYSAPAGATNNTVYADACGWENDPTDADYRSCVGPTHYTGGKAGGTLHTTYVVTVVAAGTTTLGETIYDFSGSSFHYNSDYGAGVAAFEVTALANEADVSITKADDVDPVTAGENLTYTLTASNDGPADAEDVVVTDDIPSGTSFLSASNGGTLSSGTVNWSVGTLASGASVNLTLVVAVDPGRTADLSNTAEIDSSTDDPTPGNNSDTEATEVDTSADLSIVKIDSADPVAVGDQLVYTLTVENDGPSSAQDVVVTDPMPAGVTVDSISPSTGSCVEAAAIVTCDLGTLPPDATATITITTTPSVPSGATLSNIAFVTSSTSDPTPGNDADDEDTDVASPADLEITKVDVTDPISAGELLTYTISVTNNGPQTAADVVASDVVPAGTSFVSATGGGTESGGTVTWTIGNMANGASTSVDVTVLVDPDRTTDLTNTASVAGSTADPDPSNDEDTELTSVVTEADLGLAKTDGSTTVALGVSATYTLTLTNNGPSTVPPGAVVIDDAPSGTTISTSDPECSVASNSVTCTTSAALAPGDAVAWDVTVNVPNGYADDTLTNVAVISSSPVTDPDAANDTAEDVDDVVSESDLSITKTDSVDPVVPGEQLTYTIGVSNAGPADAEDVVVTDPLLAGTTFVSATGGGTEAGGTVTWNVGTLANGASTSFEVTVEVDPGVTNDLSNTAAVTSSMFDPDPSNDEATENTAVTPSADLSIVKSSAASSANADSDITFTIVVTNDGPSTAEDVLVGDPVPDGTSFVSASGGGVPFGNTVMWALGDLPPGGSATLHVTLHVDPETRGVLTNTAMTSSSTPDPDSGDLEDSTTVDIEAPSDPSTDLHLQKVANHARVEPGTTFDYTVTVSNRGPGVATGVVVRDQLPETLMYLSSSTDVGTYDPGTGRWEVGTLTVGAEASLRIHVRVKADAAGEAIVNHATVAAVDQTDATPGDEAASQTVVLGAGGVQAGNGSGYGAGDLPGTGADVASLFVVLVALVFLGLASLAIGRRRRTTVRPS
jgi:uncharacterized repeat protein (TIGR01451 family)